MGFHKNRLSIFLVACALFGMGAVAAPAVEAAVIRVINNDSPGEGVQRSYAGRAGRREYRHHPRPAAAHRLPTCGEHLGWAPLGCRADPGRCHVRSIAV